MRKLIRPAVRSGSLLTSSSDCSPFVETRAAQITSESDAACLINSTVTSLRNEISSVAPMRATVTRATDIQSSGPGAAAQAVLHCRTNCPTFEREILMRSLWYARRWLVASAVGVGVLGGGAPAFAGSSGSGDHPHRAQPPAAGAAVHVAGQAGVNAA